MDLAVGLCVIMKISWAFTYKWTENSEWIKVRQGISLSENLRFVHMLCSCIIPSIYIYIHLDPHQPLANLPAL